MDKPWNAEPTIGTPAWVFGYGSLIWRQDFPYLDARPAHLVGYARRFWQGSHDHRGRADAPGRVLTLVEAAGERCRGRAFLVDAQVLVHLDYREKNGYERLEVDIQFEAGTTRGLTYLAPDDNHAFLGHAPLDAMVAQIHQSSGESGHNRDYVLELAVSLREHGIHDEHVFELEQALLACDKHGRPNA